MEGLRQLLKVRRQGRARHCDSNARRLWHTEGCRILLVIAGVVMCEFADSLTLELRLYVNNAQIRKRNWIRLRRLGGLRAAPQGY